MKHLFVLTLIFLLAACTETSVVLKESNALHPGANPTIKRKPIPLPEIITEKKQPVTVQSSYTEEVKKLQVNRDMYTINAQEDQDLVVGKRNTHLHIKSNSLVDKYGKVYTGKVIVYFKEFTNPAEIAFSNIPMVYRTGKDELRMNSAGMFEIKATDTQGEELFVGKDEPILVDYKLVKKVPNNRFYRLDAKKNVWVEVSKIEEVDSTKYRGDFQIYFGNVNKKIKPLDFKNDSLLRREEIASKKYTGIINGLAVSQFGIYNCDQVYRLANPVAINAQYIDRSTKKKLADPVALSLIDLSYNGAFRFDPRKFTCDGQARNVLLLFCESGALYYLDEKQFKTMNLEGNGTYTFKMTNVSDKIKNTDDLKSLLNI
jgi:hypothetical protein